MDYIRNRGLLRQIVSFKDMLYGSCRPTDIDLSMDFNREVFIFAELKFAGSGLTTGQKIHLLGLVDAIEAGGRRAYAFLATHEARPDEDIVAGLSLPVMVYTQGAWGMCPEDTLGEAIAAIEDEYRNPPDET